MTLPGIDGLDTWLALREGAVPHLRPGCAKVVTWAGAQGARTPLSVVYVHGFTASRRELSPYPERVAQALGANLFGTRLDGHGQDGAAMGRATLAAWRADVAEALAVGRLLGGQVLAIGCSMGATLLTLALAGGEGVAGAAMLSPLYGTRSRRVQAMLDLPLAPHWVPLVMRGEIGAGLGGERAEIWTQRYPATAYLPLGKAVRALRRADLDAIRAPALFAASDADRVVDAGLARAVARRWGAPVEWLDLSYGLADDPAAHVPAGLLSPSMTDALAEATLTWARAAL